LQGADTLNKRPNKDAGNQKYIIDKVVQEMLDSCFIQNSCNYYAKLVVLVEKKDGFWRLCADYSSLTSVQLKPGFQFLW